MAENDIYNSESKYLRIKQNYKSFIEPKKKGYYCKNPYNIKYYPILFNQFDLKDISFVRRIRLIGTFNLILYATSEILSDINDSNNIDEINKITIFAISRYSPNTMSYFITDLKYIWKLLFPEKDNKDRVDYTLVPYVVRHLNSKVDVSRQKRRNDILTITEYEKIISSFSDDPRLQAFFSLCYDSLARPQELLYLKIKDIELFNNWGHAFVSEHGKEGIKLIRIIDSYPYVLKWYNQHPLKHNLDSFFFINTGQTNKYKQLTNVNINKHLKIKLKHLGINKNITCYSFKRNGVTFKRLSGKSDKDIQDTAGWTSTKQLKIYDISSNDESFKIELMKRGLIEIDKDHEYLKGQITTNKTCPYCKTINGHSETTCINCTRLLDLTAIEKEERQKESEKQELRIIKEDLNKIKQKSKLEMNQLKQELKEIRFFLNSHKLQ
jgi:integrase/uncharacterized Zn finger protein (UPF0148 family)